MKKTIAFISALCLAFVPFECMIPDAPCITASASYETVTEDGITYLTDGNSVTAAKYDGKAESIKIRAEVNGLPVTKIGDEAFKDCENIKSIEIPDTVTEIGVSAFCGCISLETVSLPQSLTDIKNNAFACCSSLERIIIPDSVTNIEEFAFHSCSNLKSVKLPENLTVLQSGIFVGCESLSAINLPESLIYIGSEGKGGTFTGCDSLKEINIGKNVRYINNLTFKNTSNPQINISEENPYFTAEDSVIFSKDKSKLIIGYTYSGKSYTIPEETIEIGQSAFSGCGLEEIHFNKSLKAIGEYAFAMNNLSEINLPEGIKTIEKSSFEYNQSLAKIVLPESLEKISSSAFMACDALKEITVPASVTDIGDYAFGYVYYEYYFKELKTEDFKVYGYKDSAAEKYAFKNVLEFIPLDDSSLTGDINNDRIIDSNDSLCLLKYIVGSYDIGEESAKYADLNRDGEINSEDALLILNYIVGNINEI